MIKEKISKYFLYLLTFIGIFPFFLYLFQFSTNQNINLRTPISPLMIQPKALVYSSDYFFTSETIVATLKDGSTKNILWREIIPENHVDNFLYYIYLRHVFNRNKLNEEMLNQHVKLGIKQFICTINPSFKSVDIQYNEPFSDKRILNVTGNCYE